MKPIKRTFGYSRKLGDYDKNGNEIRELKLSNGRFYLNGEELESEDE